MSAAGMTRQPRRATVNEVCQVIQEVLNECFNETSVDNDYVLVDEQFKTNCTIKPKGTPSFEELCDLVGYTVLEKIEAMYHADCILYNGSENCATRIRS